jgi:uncharacterized HAD superfamily protein
MKIMVDLDRTIFDCPSLVYFFGNMSFGESNLDKELEYVLVDPEKSKDYANNLFFIKMSHAKNFTPVDEAVKILNKWHEQGIEVTFVSSRANFKAFHKATIEWLEMFGVKYKNVVMDCNNKAKYGQLNGFDMLVDDTLKNCNDCMKVGIIPIWIRTKYNAKQTAPEEMLQATNWGRVDEDVQSVMDYTNSVDFEYNKNLFIPAEQEIFEAAK